MKYQHDISIIIPVFNTGKYLSECLDSLLNQGLENYEIIIIDDGSTDNSAEIIEKYSNSYSNIINIYQKNNGQGSARNKGLKIAQGEYIYFMDSDDYLTKNSLSYLYKRAKEKELDLISFDGESFYDEDSKTLEKFKFNYSRNKSFGTYNSGEKLMIDQLLENSFLVSPCLYLFRAEIIKSYSLHFKEKIIHEDELFAVKLFLSVNRSEHINESYFKRRIRLGSTMTSSKARKKYESYLLLLEEMNKIVDFYEFESIGNKKIFIQKKIKGIYFALSDIVRENKLTIPESQIEKVASIYNKFNGFGITGYLYENHYKIYQALTNIRDKISKIRIK